MNNIITEYSTREAEVPLLTRPILAIYFVSLTSPVIVGGHRSYIYEVVRHTS